MFLEETNGLTFLVGQDGQLPACAEALRDALRIYEIDVGTHIETNSKFAANAFVFWIGAGTSD